MFSTIEVSLRVLASLTLSLSEAIHRSICTHLLNHSGCNCLMFLSHLLAPKIACSLSAVQCMASTSGQQQHQHQQGVLTTELVERLLRENRQLLAQAAAERDRSSGSAALARARVNLVYLCAIADQQPPSPSAPTPPQPLR